MQTVPAEKKAEHHARNSDVVQLITVTEHLDLLRNCGFTTVELLWMSYM